MPRERTPLAVIALLVPVMVTGHACAATSIVPASLKAQLDPELTFTKLKTSPAASLGRLVVLGGEVLSATLLKEGTRIEVLQIPLQANQEPGTDRLTSEGRFLAIQKEFLDPATLPAGTRVTIVGEVSGATTLPLDETEYTYPTLAIKTLRTWPDLAAAPYRYGMGPSIGPYYYWGPYWRPLWPRSPYWW